uniref:Protein kinase domain-containing protein n=1 Tax=Panagrolaimus sp. PS1159 TaxID=55785 RepID=A0AC35GKV5_9BILA
MKLMDFKKHKLLGKGAFSKVYLAEYKRKGKYALKEIKKEKLGPDTFSLCFNEIKIHQLIKSPHVIRYYGKISTLDRLYICLEYMDGMDLKHAIQVQREKGRVMSERSIWYILHQICYGLKDLHKQKILHR